MSTFPTLTFLRRRVLPALAVIASLSLLHLADSTALAQTEANEVSQNDPIEGSWICKIDKLPQGGSFTALTSFTAGGLLSLLARSTK